jgi:hypothetical protein
MTVVAVAVVVAVTLSSGAKLRDLAVLVAAAVTSSLER